MTNPAPAPAAPSPDPQGTPIAVQDVVAELIRNPLGEALWGRAQLAVLARRQEEELRYLRSLQTPAAPPAPPGGGS